MERDFGSDNPVMRRRDGVCVELETDWNYLRANLDHPSHRLGFRLGSNWTSWLFRHLQASPAPAPLSILGRIALGPRQSVALIEAEGVRLLMGISAEGPPSFYSLKDSSSGNADRASDHAATTTLDSNGGNMGGQAPARSRPIPSNIGARPASRIKLRGRVSWI